MIYGWEFSVYPNDDEVNYIYINYHNNRLEAPGVVSEGDSDEDEEKTFQEVVEEIRHYYKWGGSRDTCPVCGRMRSIHELHGCECTFMDLLRHYYDPYKSHPELRDAESKIDGSSVQVFIYDRVDRGSRDVHVKSVYFGITAYGNVVDCIEENRDKLSPLIPIFGKPNVFNPEDTEIDDTGCEDGAETY